MSEDGFADQEDNSVLNISGVWEESDFSLDNSLNESFVSLSSNQGTPSKRSHAPSSCENTPSKKKTKVRGGSDFKEPSAPKICFAQCHICRNKLITKDGFNSHMTRHRLQSVYVLMLF